jgi:hypothetical protein
MMSMFSDEEIPGQPSDNDIWALGAALEGGDGERFKARLKKDPEGLKKECKEKKYSGFDAVDPDALKQFIDDCAGKGADQTQSA